MILTAKKSIRDLQAKIIDYPLAINLKGISNMGKYVKISILLLLVGCKTDSKNDQDFVEVNQATIGHHIERLASDEFMGRKPFTQGEVKTVSYLKEEFSKLGLLPGNGDSFFQDVPMVEITGTPADKLKISGPNGDFDLNYLDDFALVAEKIETENTLDNSERTLLIIQNLFLQVLVL